MRIATLRIEHEASQVGRLPRLIGHGWELSCPTPGDQVGDRDDAGYDSQPNHELLRDVLGIDSLIPATLGARKYQTRRREMGLMALTHNIMILRQAELFYWALPTPFLAPI